jgi:type VI secretion system secreted protein Hcp
MAVNSYLNLTSSKQGEITGSATDHPHEGSIEVLGWSHEVISPRDIASGAATGKRQHRPIIISKPIDRATPLLMRALITNEIITSWRLECWRMAKDGTPEPYYRIELTDAAIIGISTEETSNQQADMMTQAVREHVSFNYAQIAWTWLEDGVTTEDNLGKYQA